MNNMDGCIKLNQSSEFKQFDLSQLVKRLFYLQWNDDCEYNILKKDVYERLEAYQELDTESKLILKLYANENVGVGLHYKNDYVDIDFHQTRSFCSSSMSKVARKILKIYYQIHQEEWISTMKNCRELLSWIAESVNDKKGKDLVRLAAIRYLLLKMEDVKPDWRWGMTNRKDLISFTLSETERIYDALNRDVVELRHISDDSNLNSKLKSLFDMFPKQSFSLEEDTVEKLKRLNTLLGEKHPIFDLIKSVVDKFGKVPQHKADKSNAQGFKNTWGVLPIGFYAEANTQNSVNAPIKFGVEHIKEEHREDVGSYGAQITAIIPESKRDITYDWSLSYIKHAWNAIKCRRRGLPDNWVFSFDKFPVLMESGITSFRAKEHGSVFIAEVVTDTATFTMVLDEHDKCRYQGGLALLSAAILLAIADMVCYTIESEANDDLATNKAPKRRKTVRRSSGLGTKKRYFPYKRYDVKIFANRGSKEGIKIQQATYVPWHWMHLIRGRHMSQQALIYARTIARWEEDVPVGCTFVRPCWKGEGERNEKLAVSTYLYESFVITMSKILNPGITTI